MDSQDNNSRYPQGFAQFHGERLQTEDTQLIAMGSDMLNERKLPMNPPGFVPLFGQGLVAKETQLGAIGTKEWMKSIKLHKYWPLVSHWSYWQMLALTEDNMEYNIKMVGGTEITRGARGKFLRSIEELRQRKPRLKKIIDDLGTSFRRSLEADLLYLKSVIYTPLPTAEDDSLPTLLVHSIHKMREYIALRGNSFKGDKNLDKIAWAIKQNPVLSRAEYRLQRLPILWEMQLTLTNYAVKSSRILPLIQRERVRTTSVDSGFEENSDACTSKKEVSSTCPIRMTVMLELPKGDEYQKLPLHSPFCIMNEDTSDEEDFLTNYRK